MKTPSLVTFNELCELVVSWMVSHADIEETNVDLLDGRGLLVRGRFKCTKCQTAILRCSVYYSLHASDFPGCAGPGHVIVVPIPYCPQCETRPEENGCIHIPYREIHSFVPSMS